MGLVAGKVQQKWRSRRTDTPAPAPGEREQWGSSGQFFMSSIAYAVGLSNIWRFPYKVYASGGGAFLIPYVIIYATCGIPMMMMENALGQYTARGAVSVFELAPLLKGIGWCMLTILFMAQIYINMILSYAFYYFFVSFTSELPWQHCMPEWVPLGCVEVDEISKIARPPSGIGNQSMISFNISSLKTPSLLYWEQTVLQVSGGIDKGLDDIRWQLILCYLLTMALGFIINFKGIRISGKIMCVTGILPYILLTILLIRNVLLEGSAQGIMFYLTPTIEKLQTFSVWYEASVQVFFSMGISFGGLITMASFNKFNNNLYRSSILIGIIDGATSIFAGFVVFTILGHMSYKTNIPIEQVADPGPGFFFVTIAQAIALMPVPPLWSVLFFLMLIIVSVDSTFTAFETLTTGISDEFDSMRANPRAKRILLGGLVLAMFMLAIPLTTKAGIYIVALMDHYTVGIAIQLTTLFEIIAVSWVYGVRRFCEDIKAMIGFEPNLYWRSTWLVITPATVLFVIISNLVLYKAPMFNGELEYPQLAHTIGWAITFTPVALIPLYAIYRYCRNTRCQQTMKNLSQPDDKLKPRSSDCTIQVGVPNSCTCGQCTPAPSNHCACGQCTTAPSNICACGQCTTAPSNSCACGQCTPAPSIVFAQQGNAQPTMMQLKVGNGNPAMFVVK